MVATLTAGANSWNSFAMVAGAMLAFAISMASGPVDISSAANGMAQGYAGNPAATATQS